jgi:ribosomal protein S18 acetylase RimI-like enzyme
MLVVEPARDEDVISVAKLAGRALDIDPSTWEMHDPCCMVARNVKNDEIVGFALADRDAPCEGHLLALAVDRNHRNGGLGGNLLERIRYQMQREGAMRMVLEVRANDLATQRFYTRHGFHPEGLERHAYGDGEDAVTFAQPL